MLQCVAVCCSVLQCVAVRCSALQVLRCVAVRLQINLFTESYQTRGKSIRYISGMLQCVAVCCSVSRHKFMDRVIPDPKRKASDTLAVCVAVCCSVLQCVAGVAVCCSASRHKMIDRVLPDPKREASDTLACVLQCVAVCCSVLQCVAVRLDINLWTESYRTRKEMHQIH